MNKLQEQIINQIKSSAPISFYEFMKMALYDKEFGYYFTSKEKIGRSGDFYTSSNISSAFGALLAKECLEMHSKIINIPLGKLHKFNNILTIIEVGAGTGQLAFDILYTMEKELNFPLAKIKYLIQEISPAMQALQKNLLAPFSSQIEWIELEELKNSPKEAIIIANEVIDSFPIHQIRWYKKELQELYIDIDGEKLTPFWQNIEKMPKNIAFYLEHLSFEFVDKQVIEINLEAIDWLKQISDVLKKGFVIIIDYGDLSDHLYSLDHFEGTLRCFFQHMTNSNYLENIGSQDITTDVNFEILMKFAQYNKLETLSFMRQADYLIKLGLLDRLQKMIELDPSSFQSLKARLAIKNFFIPGGISDHFKVLILKKI
ncbi:MAG: SAM-dependent methyltransferase [Acidobacteria bacterium]|nr:SAM-dependent methyltransferase [Acidobacteriota bacterium]